MHLQYTVYLWPLVASTVICAALAVFVWRRRPAPGATALAVLMVAIAAWSLGYAFRLVSTDLPGKLFWAKARYLGILLVPAAWLAFAIQYTGYGQRWLRPWGVGLLAVEPAIMLILIWTNEAHHLFWGEVRLTHLGSLVLLSTSHGPAFWIHTVYSYLLLALGSALLALLFSRSSGLYREQASALLLALLLPLVGSVLSIFQIFPVPLDLVPFAFTLAGLALAWGLFRSRLLEIAPVAREAVIEAMPEGTLVMDAQHRVVDLNPMAAHLLGVSTREAVGRPVEQVLAEHPILLDLCHREMETTVEVALGEGEERRAYGARFSALRDPAGRSIGWLLMLYDITESKRAREILQRELKRLQVTAEVARSAATTREIGDLLERTVDLLRDLLGFDQAAVFLTDERRQVAILTAVASREGPALERGGRWRVGEAGLVGEAIRSGYPRTVRDLDVDASARQGPLMPGARAQVAVPIQIGDRCIGVLDVQSRTPAAFDENDVAVLRTVADQLAAFIENVRLIREMEQTMRELEVASGRTDRMMWESVLRQANRPFGYRFREVELEPVEEVYPEALQAWREGRPVTLMIRPEDDGRGGVGTLAVPIRLRGQVIGVIDLRFEGETVPSDMVAMAEEVAERLALALENARLMEETRQRALHEQLRAEISARVRTSTDVDTILRTAVEELGRALRASEGLIRLEIGDVPSPPASGAREDQK